MNIMVKKVPERMCVACNKMKPKDQLMRMTRVGHDEICIDQLFKRPGRGAYICKDIKCIELARKKGRIERALKVKKADEIYEKLFQMI